MQPTRRTSTRSTKSFSTTARCITSLISFDLDDMQPEAIQHRMQICFRAALSFSIMRCNSSSSMGKDSFEFCDRLLGSLVARNQTVVDYRWSDRARADAACRQQRELFLAVVSPDLMPLYFST